MSHIADIAPLLTQLRAYKRKYYVNQLIRGLLLAVALLLTAFLVVNALEFWGQFAPSVKIVLVFGYLGLLLAVAILLIGKPIWQLASLDKVLSHEEAARQIGKHFPQVADKLVNTLQLASLNAEAGSLISAGIQQRTAELRLIPFTQAVDFRVNLRYLRYVVPPVLLALLLAFFVPQFFTEGTTRLVNYSKVYLPEAPFSFELLNQELKAYRGEDFTIRLKLTGKALPEQAYVILGGRPQLMTAEPDGYSFTIRNIQRETSFAFQAAGFTSEQYDINLIARPALLNFRAVLTYPAYLGRKAETLDNVGNFTVPQGTTVSWLFNSQDTDSLLLVSPTLNNGRALIAEKSGDAFSLKARLMQTGSYELKLRNALAGNQEPIRYQAEVIADQYPTIAVDRYQDSTLYNYLMLGGNLSDDYGLSRLTLFYRILKDKQPDAKGRYRQLPIRIQPGQIAQQFVYNWAVDTLNLRPGDQIDYYLQVWDNDGVNGPKGTRSAPMRFALPDQREIDQQLSESSTKAEKQMQSSMRKAESLRRDLQKLEERLKGKNQLSFQDQKAVEELLKKQQEVRKEVEQLQQQYQQLSEQQNRFDKPNEELQRKLDDLKQIMEQLLDPETKRLYDQLQKLLDERAQSPEQIKDILDKLEKKETNLSKELDRTLQLFKQLQVEQQMNKAIEKLNELADKQEKLADKTEKQDPDQKADKGDKSDKSDKGDKSDKKDSKSDKDQKGAKDGKESKDKKDQKDGKDSKDGKESKDGKDQKDGKDSKDGKDQKDGKESKDGKDQKDGKDSKDGKDDKSGDDADSKDQDQQQGDDGKQDEQQGQQSPQEQLEKQQKELQEEFKQLEEDLKKLEELNKELDQPNQMPDNKQDKQEVEQEQKESQQNIQQKKNKKAAKNQRQAAKKMKQMAQQMAAAAAESEEEQAEENADDLRKILDNLLTLSFDQESLMKDFRNVSPADPRYIPLGQKQLKLRDDAKIIEDSLTALAKRVAQISTFITRELSDMKNYMDEATQGIKLKRMDIAAGKQQFAMTSMNNLALLLSDVLKQMQDEQQQQQSASSSGKKKKKKPKPGQGTSLSKLQQQLNQQIQQLQQGQKTGRQLSEELAKMAAQQEALRKALQELEKQQMSREKGDKGNGGLGQLKDLMEKTEQDLVNKRLNPDIIRRQADILSRLLEAENAMREREQDPTRESKTAKELNRPLPPGFAEYLKQKEQQVELLKSLPPNLTPFYKQEVTRYFMQLGQGR